MTSLNPSWQLATPDDQATVLQLMREFYLEEELTYNEERNSRALAELLSTPSFGAVFLLRSNDTALGYLVITYGFSAEFGGRFSLLDELYLHPLARGKGEGKRALSLAESWSREQGITATRLEVNHHNDNARSIYLKAGYLDDQRSILTKWLEAPSSSSKN